MLKTDFFTCEIVELHVVVVKNGNSVLEQRSPYYIILPSHSQRLYIFLSTSYKKDSLE